MINVEFHFHFLFIFLSIFYFIIIYLLLFSALERKYNDVDSASIFNLILQQNSPDFENEAFVDKLVDLGIIQDNSNFLIGTIEKELAKYVIVSAS